MNEFVNHQIARNTIIVDVENMLDDTIFNLLFDKYSHVLYSPSSDEYRAIFEDCFKRYSINTAMLFRYARRRSNAEQIRRFINENTNITLGDKR